MTVAYDTYVESGDKSPGYMIGMTSSERTSIMNTTAGMNAPSVEWETLDNGVHHKEHPYEITNADRRALAGRPGKVADHRVTGAIDKKKVNVAARARAAMTRGQ